MKLEVVIDLLGNIIYLSKLFWGVQHDSTIFKINCKTIRNPDADDSEARRPYLAHCAVMAVAVT